MREIQASVITDAVEKLCMDAAYYLPEDVKTALQERQAQEESEIEKYILNEVCENFKVAAEEQMPLCQDTGTALFIIEMGQELVVTGGGMVEAINEGVRRGYTNGYLRKSMVAEPIFAREHQRQHPGGYPHRDYRGRRSENYPAAQGRRRGELQRSENATPGRRLAGRDGFCGGNC